MRYILTILFLLLLSVGSSAQSMQDWSNRLWTTKDGRFSVVAKLLELSGDTVTLQRQDSGKRVVTTLDKLSKEDADYILEVRSRLTKISLLIDEANSLLDFCRSLDPLIDSKKATASANETTVQKQKRENEIDEQIAGEAFQKEFLLFVQIKDVAQGDVDSKPGESFKDHAARRRNVFKITVARMDYPIHVPEQFSVESSDVGNLKIGDYLCLRCKITESQKSHIDELRFKYKRSDFTCKVVGVTIPDRAIADTALKNFYEEPPETKPSKLTRKQFRAELTKLGNGKVNTLSIYHKPTILKKFGAASKSSQEGNLEYWEFECSDGVVYVTVRHGMLAPGQVFMESIK